MPGVDEDAEVPGPGALDELDVLVDDLVLDRRGRVDLGADDHIELLRQRQGRYDDLGPDRVRDQVAGDDADLRTDEPEPEPLGEAQVALQGRGALLDGHVAPVRAAGVQPGIDPRAVVRRFEAVLLQQPEPVLDPLRRGVRIVRDVPLAEDLDARPQRRCRSIVSRDQFQRRQSAHTRSGTMAQLTYERIRILRGLQNRDRRVSGNKQPDDLDGLAKGGFVESRWLNVSETLYSITAKGRAALHEAEGND